MHTVYFDLLQRNLKGLYFIYCIFYIFLVEALYFVDYSSFIHCVTYKLARMNILYVKLFQAIALNHQFIDDSLNQFLLSFTDNAPWRLEDIDYETLIEVVNDNGIFLQDGFEHPINAGMISLVYKGTMNSLPVIIKVKRRNIHEKLEAAIENVLSFLSLLSFVPFKTYNIESIITKNIYLIREQLDFQKEAQNMYSMKNNFASFKYIQIPKLYIHYTNAILMEYIEGKSIQDVDEADYEGFAKNVLKFGTASILIHGFSHGDLHAGNILFLKDYKLGILDFGIVYTIDTEFRNVLFEIMFDLTNSNQEKFAKIIMDSGMFIQPVETVMSLKKKDYDFIFNLINDMLKDVFNSNCNQAHFYYFIQEFHKYMTTHLPQFNLTMSDNVIKTQLALAMTHGVTMKLCKYSWGTLFTQVMKEMFPIDFITQLE